MPIDLEKIPPRKSLPDAPNKRYWLLFILVLVSVGTFLISYFSSKGYSSNVVGFWGGAFAIPLFFLVFCYVVRLRHYENRSNEVTWWNEIHQKIYDEQVMDGQRAASLLGCAYITPIANNKLAQAVLNFPNPLISSYSSICQCVQTTAQITPPINEPTLEEYQQRLVLLFDKIIRMLQLELSQIPTNLVVRIRHDGCLSDHQIQSVWESYPTLSQRTKSLHVFVSDDGFMWLDRWLDKKEETFVLSIEINLFLEKRDGESESISALLLAPEKWVSLQGIPDIAKIHRPTVINGEHISLLDAARWGMLTAKEPYDLWQTQLAANGQTEILQAMSDAGYLSEMGDSHSIDALFGNPGKAVGNISIILASEQAKQCQRPQWVMIEDNVPCQLIVRPR